MQVQRIEIEYTPIPDTENKFRCILYVEKEKGTEVVHVPLEFSGDETEVSQVRRTLGFLYENLY